MFSVRINDGCRDINQCTDERFRNISILDDSHVCHECDTQETNHYASVMNIISMRMNHNATQGGTHLNIISVRMNLMCPSLAFCISQYTDES